MRPAASLNFLTVSSAVPSGERRGLPCASHSMGSAAGFSGEIQNSVGLSPRRAMPMAGWMRYAGAASLFVVIKRSSSVKEVQ